MTRRRRRRLRAGQRVVEVDKVVGESQVAQKWVWLPRWACYGQEMRDH